MTDYRALCAELFKACETLYKQSVTASHHQTITLSNGEHPIPISSDMLAQDAVFGDLLHRTRAALAQPEPEGPSDEELLRLAGFLDSGSDVEAVVAFGRAAYNLALAQPEPEGLTDEELLGYMLKAAASVPGGQCTGILDWDKEAIAAARAVIAADRARWGRPAVEPLERWFPSFADWLEREMPEGTVIGDPLWWASKIATYLQRYGRPAIKPVPVAERLPGPEDCDAQGKCWFLRNLVGDPTWSLEDPSSTITFGRTYFLPHWALPVPSSPTNE